MKGPAMSEPAMECATCGEADPSLCDCPTCQDGPEDCSGPVGFHTTPDRRDGRAFPRCQHHAAERMDRAERNLEFDDWARNRMDPADAGERYDEDY